MDNPKFVSLDKDIKGEVDINKDVFIVGRSLRSNYVVEKQYVSRAHFSLTKEEGIWILENKSQNGTFVNEKMLTINSKTELKDGDKIGFLAKESSFQFKLPKNVNTNATILNISDEELCQIAEEVDSGINWIQINDSASFSQEVLNDFSEINKRNDTNTCPNKANNKVIKTVDLTKSPKMLTRSRAKMLSQVENPITSSLENIMKTEFIPEHVMEVEVDTTDAEVPMVTNSKVLTEHTYSASTSNTDEKSKIAITINVNVNKNDTNEAAGPSKEPQPSCSNAAPSVKRPHSQEEESESQAKRKSDSQDTIVNEKQSSEPQKQLQPPLVTSNALETMEDELTCSICSELFVKAMTLNCAHSFCRYCIGQWRAQSKICPICRTTITGVNPTLVLDNFIAKSLESASEEVKTNRKELVAQRETLDNPPKPTLAPSTSGRNPTIDLATIDITYSDDEEDDDDDLAGYGSSYNSEFNSDWDEEEEYNGLPGRYYGGYGRCYKCGRHGHWSNGCPNR